MPGNLVRMTLRVYEDHPLYHLVVQNPQGAQLVLAYATAFFGYLQGLEQGGGHPVKQVEQTEELGQGDVDLPQDFLEDALS